MTEYQLLYYQSTGAEQPFTDRLAGLADIQARARLQTRLNRLAFGDFGDCKPVGDGVLELRIDWGLDTECILPVLGKRFSFSSVEETSRRNRRIDRAKGYLEDYKGRATKRSGTRTSGPRQGRP